MAMDKQRRSLSNLFKQDQNNDVYYDSVYTTKRSSRWQQTKFFTYLPIYMGVFGSFIFTFILALFGAMILMILNSASAIFYSQDYLMIYLDVPFRVSPFISCLLYFLTKGWLWLVGIVLAIAAGVATERYQARIKAFETGDDINDYKGDARLLTVPEIVQKYRAVPDQGAHFKGVNVTAIVSHIALNNDGVDKVNLPVLESIDGKPKGEAKAMVAKEVIGFKAFIPKGVRLKNGDKIKATMTNPKTGKREGSITYIVGDKPSKKQFGIIGIKAKKRMIYGRMIKNRKVVLTLPNGKEIGVREEERITNKVLKQPQKLIDEKDGIRQMENVGMRDKKLQVLHSPKKLIVDGTKNLTLAEYINENWFVPEYETQVPSGAYLVDDSPINVLVVAMTRGNKGQCIVNPTLDLWSRQTEKVNIFVNDPKGELYTSFYSTLKIRGFEVVVFNLLDPAFTDQFNPLAEAITYARKGYRDETQKVLTNLEANFFPMPPGQEPVWTNGERSLFRMLSLVMIDYYYEEEQEYLSKYGGVYDEAKIQRDLDELWSNVTLSNIYRLVSALATRKFKRKSIRGEEMFDKDGNPIGEEETNMLEKLFELTTKLPRSNIRELFQYPYGDFQAMADSEKMRSSIYGMALTEMSFFVEGPIIALTSASPTQSFDLISMSFPRRFAFKLNEAYITEKGWKTMMVKFELYRDPYFKDKYKGKAYEHVTRIDKLGWAEMRFEAILDKPITYVKMTIYPRIQTEYMEYGTFYAQFTKGYQKSPDGRTLLKDPVTNDFQIKDGVLRMGVMEDITPDQVDGKYINLEKFDRNSITQKFVHGQPKGMLSSGEYVNVFVLSEATYQEKPMAVFSVTPPSSLVYVKIILMVIHSLFNSNVENSYITKDNGKPLLKTKNMLDEAGNLQYEGTGIDSLPTKLSIGLAQGQEYTMIFQTLQQITDIYGQTADRIISSNTGLSIFLLSNDTEMLENLSKESGTHHVSRKKSKTLHKDVGTMADHIEKNVDYTMSTEEEPLLSVNRLLKMTNGEALMLTTTKRTNNDGTNVRQQPVFNTQDTSLPMSWSLHKYGYGQRSYSMLTVPTLNSTVGLSDKIPSFEEMIYKRAAQAALAPVIINKYKLDNNLSDIEYDMQDPLVVGHALMRKINETLEKIHALTDEETEELKLQAFNQDVRKMNQDYANQVDANELQITQQGLNDLIEDNTGITLHQDETGRPVIDNVVMDEDTLASQHETQVEKDKEQAMTIGNGRFNLDNMGTAQMRTALSQAIGVLNRSYLQSFTDWQLMNQTSPVTLYHNSNKMAEKIELKQSQTQQSVHTGQQVTKDVKGEEWQITDAMVQLFKDTEDWDGLIGRVFADEVERLFFKHD